MTPDDRPKLRVLVLGTGAMGSAVAGLLAHQSRSDVTIAGRWVAALEALRERGVLVETPEGRFASSVSALTLDEVPGRSYDAVIVLVKSTATADVAPVAARARLELGLVLTLQNGLGNFELLAAAAGEDNVVAGVAGFGATSLGPGHVRVFPGSLAIGASPTTALRLAPLATAFARAGMTANISPSRDRVLWTKLAINCAINPVAALHRKPNGQLLAIPEARSAMLEAAAEVARVAAARGTDIGPYAEDRVLLAAERTAGNLNSMLQDVLRGVPTEIESLNGALVHEAQRLGVPVPVNEHLRDAIRAIDRSLMRAGECRPC